MEAAARRADAATPHWAPGGWALFRRLIASQVAIGEPARAFRLAWRFVRSPIETLRWLETLERVCVRAGVETAPYRLARKASQKFLRRALPRAATINLLTTHYERLLLALGSQNVGRILSGEVIVAAEIAGRSAVPYRLCLARETLNSREGELIVNLVRKDDDRRVASLSVVVGAMAPGRPVNLWIGGLQGSNGADSKAVTVRATRDLWGLRPKDLLMHAAYALADVFEVESIEAVSNAGHVLQPAKGVKEGWRADYDAFWRECGGAPIAGDFFLLPKARPRRSVEEVSPAKRKAWRARYALADEISADIRRLAIRRRVDGRAAGPDPTAV
jgi:hypothetical protein